MESLSLYQQLGIDNDYVGTILYQNNKLIYVYEEYCEHAYYAYTQYIDEIRNTNIIHNEMRLY